MNEHDIPIMAVPEPVMALQQIGVEPSTGRPLFVMVPAAGRPAELQAIGIFEQEEVAEAVRTALALQAIQLFLERLPVPLSGRWFRMQDGPAIPRELAEVLYAGEEAVRRFKTDPIPPLEMMEGQLSYQRASMQWVNSAAREAMLNKLREIGGAA